MARYTVELREIVKSGHNIFDFPYEFYDEKKKPDFEQAFINHFYLYEIGTETVGRFKHYLKLKFNERLPYYNSLFKLTLLSYDILNNYDVTETITKEINRNNQLTGNSSTNGSATENATVGNTLNRTAGVVVSGERSQNLDSTTDHSEQSTFNKNETIDETNDAVNTKSRETDNKHVESETPSGLLTMEDIENNVYASKAIIDDNADTQEETNKVTGKKTGTNTENTERGTVDKVKGTTTETSTDTNDETVKETNSGNSSNNTSFGNNTNNSQTQTGNETETFTRKMIGNIGVQTNADQIQKEIELSKTLSTILEQFFEDCEDLFMQIFSF